MLEQLEEIFRTVFKNNSLLIRQNTVANDIKMWDSLTHLELIAAIETKFNIKFSFEEVMQFKSVGDMLVLIEKKLKK